MTTALAREELKRFLASEKAEVLCITGKWGVGKTYAWQESLQAAVGQGKVALKRYAYVSLFGQNSLDDVRYALFENTVPIDRVAGDIDIEMIASSLNRIEEAGRRSVSFLKVIPALNSYRWILTRSATLGALGLTKERSDFPFPAAAFRCISRCEGGSGERKIEKVQSAQVALRVRIHHLSNANRSFFLFVREQIICFDDLERAGKGLEAKDVLGLITFLKEQRRCKVVLLLNQEALDEVAGQDFRTQLEKVADITLEFSPSSAEAAAIAFNAENKISQQLKRQCEILGITNIRVMVKIRRLAERLETLLSEFDEGSPQASASIDDALRLGDLSA